MDSGNSGSNKGEVHQQLFSNCNEVDDRCAYRQLGWYRGELLRPFFRDGRGFLCSKYNWGGIHDVSN